MGENWVRNNLMTNFTKTKLLFCFKLVVGLSLITILLSWTNVYETAKYFVHANVSLILAGAALTIGQTALSAWKWRILLLEQRVTVPFFKLFKSYMFANFVNLFSPSFLGGDAYRTASLQRDAGSISRSLSSVIADRLTGLVALFFIGSVGLGFYLTPRHTFAVSLAVIPTILIIYLITLVWVRPRIIRLASKKSWWVAQLGKDILEALIPSKALSKAMAISFLFQTNTIIISVIYSNSLKLDAEISNLLLIVPVVYIIEMVPVSINGVGLREGAFALLFLNFGMPAEQGLALGLTISVMRYVIGAAGALIWLIPDHKNPLDDSQNT
jgi:uncharacterized membrane protein YbhN (UPF0104 family)